MPRHTLCGARFGRFAIPAGVALLLFVSGASAVVAEVRGRLEAGGAPMAHSVAIGGELAVVGAPWQDRFRGGATVLARDGATWREIQRLRPDDLGPYDHFGATVSIAGDEIRVGAPWHDMLRGAVYVFRRAGDRWALHQKLAAPGTPVRHGPGSAGLSAGPAPAALSADALAAIGVALKTSGAPPAIRTAANESVDWVSATDAVFEDRVEVKWAPVDLDAILYKVMRDGVLIGIASSDDSLYKDESGARGVTYDYCVVVMDMGGGEGPPVCDAGSRVLRAPERLFASDGQFIDGVHLTWEDRSEVEAGFHVRRDGVPIATLDRNRRSYTDGTSIPLAVSTYEVVAFDGDGNLSGGASDAGFRGVVLPPLEVSATDGEFATSVRIRWVDQGGGVGFVVTRRDLVGTEPVALDTTAAGAVEYFDPTAVAGTRYQYCVSMLDSFGRLSVPECDEGGVDLAPPLNVAASDSTFDDRIQVTWEDRSGLADGYFIRRDGVPIDTVAASKRTFNDFDATPDATHAYCVVAFSDDGGASVAACDEGFRMFVLAPTGVSATDGDLEDRTQIRWESRSTTVALFKILRDGVPIKTVGPGSRAYADDGGTANREYVYGVQAVTGQLRASATATDAGRRELRKPINVAATDDAFEDRVEITWRDLSAQETGFVVHRARGDSAAADSIGETRTGTTSFVDRTGEPGVTYRYTVTAFDADGEARGESEPSEADEGIRTLLGPTAVDATDDAFEDRVEITWRDHSNVEDGYLVYRDGVPIAATADNATSFFDLTPAFGLTSHYRVRAFDAFGTSVADDDSGSTTLLPPGSLNASDTYADRIELRWVDVSGVEQGYVLRTDSAGVALRVDTLAAGATSHVDRLARPGVAYTYRLRAFAGPATSTEAADTGTRRVPAALVTSRTTLERVQGNDAGQQLNNRNWGDAFGASVAINDEYLMVVGALRDDDRGRCCIGTVNEGSTAAGAAYVFALGADGAWTQDAKLYSPAPTATGRFGSSVGISGNWVVVGSPGDNSAAFFERRVDGLWAGTRVVSNPAGQPFGNAVAIDGDRAIIGGASSPGRAYIMERSGTSWVHRAVLTASDGTAGNGFGSAVAIDGDWAIVAAFNRRQAYVYQFNGTAWIESAKLVDDDPLAGMTEFAYSVAIGGERAVVGRLSYKCFGDRGGAYVYEYDRYANAWQRVARLVPRDSLSNSACGFGHGVSISGDRIAVTTGAPAYGGDEGYEFPAYIFTRGADGTWTERERLKAGLRCEGEAVAVSRAGVVVGSDIEEAQGLRSGAVYVSEMRQPGRVTASDGSFEGLVHVQWEDLARAEEGFIVYRDGVEYANVDPDNEFFDDTHAEPGRTYEYAVSMVDRITGLISEPVTDFGWRPPNGNITGRITDRAGSGVAGVSVCLEPPPARALLLDGSGGHVRIPDDGTFNFSPAADFTVEVWFSYAGSTRTPRLISKPPARGALQRPLDLGLQRNGRLFLTLSDGTNVARVLSRRSDLNDDEWHRVACVHDADARELILYIDGAEEDRASTAGLGDLSNNQDVFIGGYDDVTWFGGQIDELRIWNTARSTAELDATGDAPLAGNEAGLTGYWPFDDIRGAAVTDYAGVPQYGVQVDGVYRTDRAAPLDVCGTTGSDGGFVLSNVRYEENGTDFKLRPSLGSRSFSPAVLPVTLNRDHPVENQIAFSDVSSHEVSGVVRFAGTNCFEPDVEIRVDGAVGAVSDRNGKFSLTLTEGVHTLRAQRRDYSYRAAFQGDTLAADSITIEVRADVRDLVFLNRTRHPVSGNVGGGCDRYVGEVTLRFRSENNCLDTTFVGNPAYTIDLPPMRYFASATIDRETIPASLVRPDVIAFFENLGERPVNLVADTDSTVIDDTLDFIYRAPLRVAVVGFEPYVDPACPRLALEDGTLLPGGLPVVPQGQEVELTILVEEAYGDSACPLDTGIVIILDELANREDKPDTVNVSQGRATYRTFAATPSLIRGRTEGTTDRSFQKALTARAVVEGRAPQTERVWALVTGHVAPAGAEFITSPSTPLPLFVLRDPPGDGSYGFIEKGSTACARLSWSKGEIKGSLGPTVKLAFGATQKVWVGVGGGTIEEIKAHVEGDVKALFGGKSSWNSTYDVCVKLSEKVKTSAEEDFIGDGADIYVGAGVNFIFAEVGVLSVAGCRLAQSTAIGFEPDGFNTTFAFTERHILQTLIPELTSKVAYFEAQGDADSAQVFRRIRESWERQVAHNRSDKSRLADTLVVHIPSLIPLDPPVDSLEIITPRTRYNRSFSGGTEYEFSREREQKWAWENEAYFTIDSEAQVVTNFGLGKKVEVTAGVAIEFAREVLVNFDTTDRGDSSMTWKVGYVLEDDDAGDSWSVDVIEHPRWGNIFNVVGGRSSCPYEPWPHRESGAVQMVQRDDPQLLIDPAVRFGVDPDEPAVFRLAIVNQSDEQREYKVHMLSQTNPGGAVVKLNGSPIGEGPVFTIDGRGGGNANVHEATLTVERGPRRMNYENLTLVVEPVCGGDPYVEKPDPFTGDTLRFNVAFEGCSEIRMSGPDVVPGWVYDHADSAAGKKLDVVLSGYERVVDPGAPNLVTAVGIQYRHMGDGRTGPGPWTDIREVPPGVFAEISTDGSPDTIIVWQPDSLANGAHDPLPDGVYELRAYTVCSAGGRGYSDASTGTIDRRAPLVFGTPHPSDGELSLGEDIGITFNEPLDCEALRSATITLKYVDGPRAGQGIPVTHTCDERTIFILPQADLALLDGRRLEASVHGVADRAGNTMTTTATWQFDYRKSLFTWSETRIAREVALAAPGKVSAMLANGTDQAVDYEVTSLPAFLGVAPSQARGRLAPGGTRSIEFDIDPQIAGGIHQGQVEMHAANTAGGKVAAATLDVVLDVSCAAPTWAIDPSRFEYSMSLVARVQLPGGTLTGAPDLVAAFVGDQLRGVAHPQDVAGDTLLFLTVFSNRTSGEMVRFEVWDDDRCRRYGTTAERAPFGADAVLGTTIAPFLLTAQDAPPGSVASFPLEAGWNWFSTNVVSADMSPGAVLASLAPAAGDVIKSKTAFAVFDPDTSIGWVGTLTTLNNTSGYMIRLTEAGTVLHEGAFADPGSTPVPVVNGWNWIGYLPAIGMSIGTALTDLVTRGFLNGDEVVKSHGSFSEWNSGWFGTLEAMAPGEGYRLKLNDPALPSSFQYPTGAPVVAMRAEDGSPARAVRGDLTRPGEGARPNPVATAEPDAMRTEPSATNAAGWPLDPGRFEHNMTLIAHVQGGGVDWGSDANLLGAFVGDECRGVVPLMHVPGLGRHLAFATVHSNTLDGETVRFRAYHAATGTIHDVTETVVFHADAPAGTIREPIALTAGPGGGTLPVAFRLAEARPNPFTHGTEIRFELPEPRRVVLKVFNVAGHEVCTLADGHYPAGAHDVRWEARTARGDPAPNGVYFYRIQAGKFVEAGRVVLVR